MSTRKDTGSPDSRKSSGRKNSSAFDPPVQIDLRAAIEAPVRIKQDGKVRAVDPYEATLRQHVRKALIDKKVPSIKYLFGEAEKHKLIKEPPPARQGGVFTVPKNLPEDIENQIFNQETSMPQMMALLLRAIKFERLRECFNGWRK